jgi:hypothetical protein
MSAVRSIEALHLNAAASTLLGIQSSLASAAGERLCSAVDGHGSPMHAHHLIAALQGDVAELRARVVVLERALTAALSQLSESDVGAAERRAVEEAVTEILQLAGSGRAPEAARHYRSQFGVTWDEAHTAVAKLNPKRVEELARRLWLKRWVEEQVERNKLPKSAGGQ